MSNLEKIKEACQKANPEIMELKFGCELKRPGSERNYKVIEDIGWGANTDKIWVNSVPFGSMQLPLEIKKARIEQKIKDHNGDMWEILGRPIRLADVLLMIKDYSMTVDMSGGFSKRENTGALQYFAIWNLRDDNLELQTEQTINFLVKLL